MAGPVANWMRPDARCSTSIEPAIALRSPAFEWDDEVRVALPASYGVTQDRHYPVLWLTDGSMLFHLAVGLLDTLVVGGLAPEMIIVGIGCPSGAGVAELTRRRGIEFCPASASMLWADRLDARANPLG
jgi:uncharacterized protein